MKPLMGPGFGCYSPPPRENDCRQKCQFGVHIGVHISLSFVTFSDEKMPCRLSYGAPRLTRSMLLRRFRRLVHPLQRPEGDAGEQGEFLGDFFDLVAL